MERHIRPLYCGLAASLRFLIVTEKHTRSPTESDGGFRLVSTLRRELGSDCDIMQFGESTAEGAAFHFPLPHRGGCRFERRLANAGFIAKCVADHCDRYSDVAFIHISTQFGWAQLRAPFRTWTFPMLLGSSYRRSCERVPDEYVRRESEVLHTTDRILTPSTSEREEIIKHYHTDPSKIVVVPRGVTLHGDHHAREPRGAGIRLCTIGSIKPQKNTLESVRILDFIKRDHPNATLRVIGPVQDLRYGDQLLCAIEQLGLRNAVELVGAVPPAELHEALGDTNLLLCPSIRETFGRATFEGISLGLPALIRSGGHAADELLTDAPFAAFYTDLREAAEGIDRLCERWVDRSRLGRGLRWLYDDALLGKILAAELRQSPKLVVADFDGTLYHSSDEARTHACCEAFSQYHARVVCSARPVRDLRGAVERLGIRADWLIGASGGEAIDGRGQTLWREGWSEPLRAASPEVAMALQAIVEDNTVLQYQVYGSCTFDGLDARVERYADRSFVLPPHISKLHSVVRLLHEIRWRGRVRVFGDGPADRPLLAFFGGKRLVHGTPNPVLCEARSISHDEP